MSTVLNEKQIKKAKLVIALLSIVIPVVVALLFNIKIEGYDNLKFLPSVYAGINGLTAIVLIMALFFVKKGKIKAHELSIKIALTLSVFFLLLYVLYHITSDSTKYLGDYKALYFSLLISHILLSVLVIPIVLYTYLFAWMGDFARHKKWTKIAWPLWFYVAVSGVVVYFMISPYYK
jgi:putative membrane protein